MVLLLKRAEEVCKEEQELTSRNEEIMEKEELI